MAKTINYCFQQGKDKVHKLYIYDDVSAHGRFNWNTWTYDESETSAKYFRDQLAGIADTDTIELHINSNGGAVKEGVAIYNQLKQKACKKVGYVDGVAYSVAFVILQACDERIMGIGTSALIHNIWIEAQGNSKELRKIADDLDVLMESNRKIFLERSNLSEEQLSEMMEKETFLTPDQCLEYGLIDEVGRFETDGREATQALQKQVEQLSELLAQQKSFKEELMLLQKGGKDPVPANNDLKAFFKNMKVRNEK